METNKIINRRIEVYDGKSFTRLDVKLELIYGFGIRPLGMLVQECKKYEREIYFRNEKNSRTSNGRSIFEMLCLGAIPGTKLQILVQGEDKEAEEIALRLCKGISTRDHFPKFNESSSRKPNEQPTHFNPW